MPRFSRDKAPCYKSSSLSFCLSMWLDSMVVMRRGDHSSNSLSPWKPSGDNALRDPLYHLCSVMFLLPLRHLQRPSTRPQTTWTCTLCFCFPSDICKGLQLDPRRPGHAHYVSASPQTFAKAFNSTPDDLDMHIIYDVSHNIAKVEEHVSSSTNVLHV